MHDMNQQPLTFASLALALANDYSSIYKNEKYQKPVFVQGITAFPQKYS